MKYKPWGWVDVFEDGKIQVGTRWAGTDDAPKFLTDITGGEEALTEEIKMVMAALDFVEEDVTLPCGSHYIDGFSFGTSIRVKTYFIYLGEHDESE